MNRAQFPILKQVTYLDTAAGALKPRQVVQAMTDFYLKYPINSRSSESRLGAIVNEKITAARSAVAAFLDAKVEEVIFTSGTTDSLNRIATMLTPLISKNDEIVLSYYNHSSNVVPFVELARRSGAKVVYATNPIEAITPKTKLVAVAQVNNTLIQQLDWAALYAATRKHGALLINDAAQAVLHAPVSLAAADVIAFSSNKLYGPTGCGALVVRLDLLKKLKPTTFGSGSIANLSTQGYQVKSTIDQFEPGTLNLAGVIGMAEGIKYHQSLKNPAAFERKLATYAYDALAKIHGIKIYSLRGAPILMFNYKDYPAQDLVSALGHDDIILRAGQHCAHLVKETKIYQSAARLSIGTYNNRQDIDKLVSALKKENFLAFLNK